MKPSLALTEWYSFLYLSSARIAGMYNHTGPTCFVSVSSWKAAARVSGMFKPWMQRTGLPEKTLSSARRKRGGSCGSRAYILENLIRASGVFDRIEWWTESNKIKFNWNKCKVLPLGPEGTGVEDGAVWSCSLYEKPGELGCQDARRRSAVWSDCQEHACALSSHQKGSSKRAWCLQSRETIR